MTDIVPTFDYAQLDQELQEFLHQIEAEIDYGYSLAKRGFIIVGRGLLLAKERLPHGQFEPWYTSKYQINRSTASRYMQLALGNDVYKKTIKEIVEVDDVELTNVSFVQHLEIEQDARSLHDHARQAVMDYLIEMGESNAASYRAIDETCRRNKECSLNALLAWFLDFKRATGWMEDEIGFLYNAMLTSTKEELAQHVILKCYAIIHTPRQERPSYHEKMYFYSTGIYFHPTEELTYEEWEDVGRYLAKLSGL